MGLGLGLGFDGARASAVPVVVGEEVVRPVDAVLHAAAAG